MQNKTELPNSVVGGPLRRAKILPYRPLCGAIISDHGGKSVVSAEIGHGGEPKNRHRYPPWAVFDNAASKAPFLDKDRFKKKRKKGTKRQPFYSVILHPSNKSDIYPKYFSSLRFLALFVFHLN